MSPSISSAAAATAFLFLSSLAGGAEQPAPTLRVGVFDDTNFPSGPRGAWYRETVQAMGHEAVALSADDLNRPDGLGRGRLDILILPDGQHIPYEAACGIPAFLADGGSVIARRLPERAVRKDETGKWGLGNWEFMAKLNSPNEEMNIMSDFQLRTLWWKEAERSLATNLALNPSLPDSLKAKLPAALGPLAKKTFRPYDTLNWIDGSKEIKGRTVETAGNLLVPLYLLPDGAGADFAAYRYHSAYYPNATLVLLGETGLALLAGEHGRDALDACLRLCAVRLPGEQEPAFYERLIAAHRAISEFGGAAVETGAQLRDAAILAFYRGDAAGAERQQSRRADLEAALRDIISEKQALDTLLTADKQHAEQDRRRQALLARVAAETKRLAEWRADAAPILKAAVIPDRPPVRSALGELPVEAGYSWCGPYALRRDFFKTMKALGVNAWYLYGTGNHYYRFLFDPQVRREMEGIRLDPAYGGGVCNSPLGGRSNLGEIMPSQGKLDIVTGRIEETPDKVYDPETLEKAIVGFLDRWREFPILRIYMTTRELGLANDYWGRQARAEYLEHLKARYGAVAALNERWDSSFTAFDDIVLPTARPDTPLEHAAWEEWIAFRQKRLFETKQTGYRLFKKHAPEIPLSSVVSTESIRKQAYTGIDLYQQTKLQDLNGIDGTTVALAREWNFLDLNTGGPMLTCEWGLFYFPPADMLRNRSALTRQLWQELSGGHSGINLWYWRSPGFNANFVDAVGLPTLLGWELRQAVADFRKFEHILLDGKRAAPSTLLLFSDTSRVHDMSWGLEGEPIFSPHVNALNQLYPAFCKRQIPARVIDQGALLDGADLSACRLLIVSHAQYLSAEVQQALLDYAAAGGTLYLDGRSGRYDNYGRESLGLAHKAGLVPRAVPAGAAVRLPDGSRYEPANREWLYAPLAVAAAGSRSLLNFESGQPALAVLPYGKGKLIAGGAPLCDAGKALDALIQPIWREAGLEPATQCSDESLLIREWEYEGRRYLICAYPAGPPPLVKFLLRIHGNVGVRDLLLGADLPVVFDGRSTLMEGLIPAPGGRVYELTPGAAKARAVPDASQAAPAPGPAEAGDGEPAGLPFQGALYEREDPYRIGPYAAQVVLIPESTGPDRGRAYLTLSRGAERRRQEVSPDREHRFVFADEILRVRVLKRFFMYPMHLIVEIAAEPRAALQSACALGRDGTDLLLSNGLLSFRVQPDRGGAITEGILQPEGINQIFGNGIKANEGQAPGIWVSQRFKTEVLDESPDTLAVRLESPQPVNALALAKTLTLRRGEARLGLELLQANRSDAPANLALRLHPELQIGGAADESDRFFVPAADGLKVLRFSPSDSFRVRPAEGWAAGCDRNARTAYVCAFSTGEVRQIYFWFGADFITFELWTPNQAVAPGSALRLAADLYWLQGLSGVDAFRDGWAAHLVIPDSDTGAPLACRLEMAGSRLDAAPIDAAVSLRRNGRTLKEAASIRGRVGFETPLDAAFALDTADLEPGDYALRAVIRGGDGEECLSFDKAFTVRPRLDAKRVEVLHAAESRLARLRLNPGVPRERLFDAYQALEAARLAPDPESAARGDAGLDALLAALEVEAPPVKLKGFERFDPKLARFDAQARDGLVPEAAILFVGSSTISQWDLAACFPGRPAVNRGLGGSTLADAIHFFDRLYLPCRPETIVLYAGDNDLANGLSPERVIADFKTLAGLIEARLPETTVIYVAVKPSRQRWDLWEKQRAVNEAIAAWCAARGGRFAFADIAAPMLADVEPGQPPTASWFQRDGLHLSPEGYARWSAVVAPLLDKPPAAP